MKALIQLSAGLAVAAAVMSTPANAMSTLTGETACAGGAPGTMVITLGEQLAAKGIANLQVQDCQTLTNSLQNLVEGKTDVAAAPFILPFLMSRGAGPYAKMGKETGAELIQNARMLYTYRFGIFALYAYDSSPVKGWGDLEGKRVLNGPPRGGALSNCRPTSPTPGSPVHSRPVPSRCGAFRRSCLTARPSRNIPAHPGRAA